MNRDELMRRALRISAAYNAGGAILFAFPSSPLGQLAGLPTAVPALYRALLALFVVLFGGVYAWLARRPIIDRPLVALSAIGKAGAFAVIFACWLLGAASARGVLSATGDLVLAGIFAWWLLGASPGTANRSA